MKAFRTIFILLILGGTMAGSAHAQSSSSIDSIQFFIDEKPLEVTLSADMKVLQGEKPQGTDYLPATFKTKLPDSTEVSEEIKINTRGIMRRKVCYMPPLRLYFHNSTSPKLYTLHTLKMVCGCKTGPMYEQFLLKEFLIYKMYNLITPRSYRARLLHVTYVDSKGKRKSFSQYAFMLESDAALAKRNQSKEFKPTNVSTESTDRRQMTQVSIFEYMVANTDWAVPVKHNIKLFYTKKDSVAPPYAVAFDFDYAGLVNADYAVPDEKLEIETVTQRLYRGFPRTMLELEIEFKVFNDQKAAIYSLINNFEPLKKSNRQDMTGYLDDFYKVINDKRQVQEVFIENARKE